MPTVNQPQQKLDVQEEPRKKKKGTRKVASSQAETEFENAIKVGGELREVLIRATIDSTSFKHVAAYKNPARRTWRLVLDK